MVRPDRHERRPAGPTRLERERAAPPRSHTRHRPRAPAARSRRSLAGSPDTGRRRDRVEEPTAVGMGRRVAQRVRRRRLDDRPRVHHEHPPADGEGDTQVVRDQHQAHPALALEAEQQVEDLPLGRGVERGRGLVGDQEPRDRPPAPPPARRAGPCHRRARTGTGRATAGSVIPTSARRRSISSRKAAPRAAAPTFRSVSSMWPPAVIIGFSIVNGSCISSPISRPRTRAETRPSAADELAAVEAHGASHREPGREERDEGACGERLSRARLADEADRLAHTDVEGDRPGRAFDRRPRPGVGHGGRARRGAPCGSSRSSPRHDVVRAVAEDRHRDREQRDQYRRARRPPRG